MKMLLTRLFALVVPLILVGSSQAGYSLGGQTFYGVHSFNINWNDGSSHTSNVGAGVFQWSTINGTSVIPNYEYTFCVDLAHVIQNPTTYDLVNINSASIQSSPTEAAALKKLFDTNGSTIAAIVANPAANANAAAALQLAIWEIIYETSAAGIGSYSLTTGNFNVTNQASIVSTAQGYLNNMVNASSSNYSLYGLNAVTPTTNSQDQIGWGNSNVIVGQPVPAPPALLLAVFGVVGMGGLSRLRSRFSR